MERGEERKEQDGISNVFRRQSGLLDRLLARRGERHGGLLDRFTTRAQMVVSAIQSDLFCLARRF